jgi:hypothetical protein
VNTFNCCGFGVIKSFVSCNRVGVRGRFEEVNVAFAFSHFVEPQSNPPFVLEEHFLKPSLASGTEFCVRHRRGGVMLHSWLRLCYGDKYGPLTSTMLIVSLL